MEYEYGLFIKFSSPQVQNAFYNITPFKNQLHYEAKNGICQEHVWEYLRKNQLY
ncbi:MAG: hypothetical protein I3273_02960 [Candidatus Moeniiplasma glomeromycotorum]|nr:hypothetical protein [Candidatus Moeniiplasma glomeromycotorum]MCE8167582.1 hypothetical protein [Candidatus Moeniiplasma glomeromycotorum]MCE8169066.1 hypothetical protein [Candidatus Moeniiplasma glomeromycotorum]